MADLYGDFHDEDDLEENEEDIGALNSILSWDEEEDEDDQAVNRDAAAMNIALRERESAPGTSAPPDMVQFSMKDGVPQFNFLSNFQNSTTQQQQQQQSNATSTNTGEGNSSSLTLQLPMPTPISKFEAYPQQPAEPTTTAAEETKQSPSPPLMNNHNMQNSNNNGNTQAPAPLQQQQAQPQQNQQSQQSLATTFAQLLAQQAGSLFQQANSNRMQQPSQQPVNTQNSQMQQQQQVTQPATQAPIQPGMNHAPTQQQHNQAKPIAQQQQHTQAPQQNAQQAAQQAAIQQVQQQLQQLQQQAQAAQRQAEQQQQIQQQQAAAPPQSQAPVQQQTQQTSQVPQVPMPFSTDPATFLQQLQFAQFQQQLQMAQQQQQQPQQQQQGQAAFAPPIAAAPISFPQAVTATPSMNVRPPQQRDAPPPAKRARKTTASRKGPALAKKPPPLAARAAKASTTASVKMGIVSASDTDCEVPANNQASSESKTASASNANQDMSDANLSTDDKAQANRDRNREHARNTRLRKKAYLEKLKATVEELCRERDALVSERAGAAGLLVEMHNTRTEVLMSFFALRSSNEKRRKLWSSILDESSFTCVMPVTPYRSFSASEVQVSKCSRTILGIDSMMADTASLHVLLDSLVDKTKYPDAKIEFRYTLVTEESVVAGNQMMARWVMSTVNATKYGALTEVAKQGMLCCKFNSQHRIIGLELMFDVMAFMLQLKQAAGTDSFSVIPNTVQTCQRTFDRPMVMTLADPPFTIVQVNKLWEAMTGYSAEEVVGKKSCSILQGHRTERKDLQKMMEDVRFKRPGSVYITNVKKSGEEFRHFLLVFPLSTDSRVTHYLALSNHVGPAPAAHNQVESTPQAQKSQTQAPAAPLDSNSAVPQVQNSMTTNNQGAAPTQPQSKGFPAQNGMQVQVPQVFGGQTPVAFPPQSQASVSNNNANFRTGTPSLMPPPKVPAQNSLLTTLQNPAATQESNK